VLTKRDAENWGNFANIKQIYNVLPFYPDQSAELETKRIISVGRFTSQKGFDLLIEAWNLIHYQLPDWQLDIFGAGEDEEMLRSLIRKKCLDNSINIHPPTKDIIKEYLNSSIYVLSSRYEGFGMVLLEAMACGLPCVSFDCPSGPSEIILNNVDGFVVENGNVDRLAEKIKLMATDIRLRKEMGRKSKENIKRFLPENIMKEWDELFKLKKLCKHLH
jgi:glycosyltransferase involved in cell wall biosynthesis